MDNQCMHYEIGLDVDRCEQEPAFAVTGHIQLVGSVSTDVFPVRAFSCAEHLAWVFNRTCLTNNTGMVEAL